MEEQQSTAVNIGKTRLGRRIFKSKRALFFTVFSFTLIVLVPLGIWLQSPDKIRVRYGTLVMDTNGNTVSDMTRYASVPREDAEKYQLRILTQAAGGGSMVPLTNQPVTVDIGDPEYLRATLRFPVLEKEINAKALAGYDVREASTLMATKVTPAYAMGDWAGCNAAQDEVRASLDAAAQVGEPVSYKSTDGTDIVALVYKPASAGPWPAIVFNAEEWGVGDRPSEVPVSLWDQGYLVLVPELRGTGSSGGRCELAGGEVDDVIRGIDYLQGQGWIAGGKVGLFGQGEGATVDMLVAERDPRIQAVVEEGGLTDVSAIFRPGLDTANTTVTYMQSLAKSATGGTPEGVPAEYARRSPAAFYQSLSAPMLMIHGDADIIVPMDQVEGMYGALRAAGRRVELKTYAGQPNGLSDPATRGDALNAMANWFDTYLK